MKTLTALLLGLVLSAGTGLAQNKERDMGGMNMEEMHGDAMTHYAVGVVKSVDAQSGKITLDHGPVKTLDWPAMTMIYHVRDRSLMPKLGMNKKV